MIRAAIIDDLPNLLRMSKSFFNASGYGDITTFDNSDSKELLIKLIDLASTRGATICASRDPRCTRSKTYSRLQLLLLLCPKPPRRRHRRRRPSSTGRAPGRRSCWSGCASVSSSKFSMYAAHARTRARTHTHTHTHVRALTHTHIGNCARTRVYQSQSG